MQFNKTFIAFVLAAVLMASNALPVKPNDAIATAIRAWVPPAAQSIAVDQVRGRSLTRPIEARRHGSHGERGSSRHRGRELEERRHGSGSRHNSHVRRNIDARQHRDLDPRRHGSGEHGGARGRGRSREDSLEARRGGSGSRGRGRSRIQHEAFELTARRHGSSSRGRGRSRGRSHEKRNVELEA